MKRKNKGLHAALVITVILFSSAAAFYYLAKRGQIPESWPITKADIVATRIEVKYVRQSKMKPAKIIYGSDYQLKYLVAGKEYFLWLDSGMRARDRESAERITQQLAEKKCQVKYNPENPGEAYLVSGSCTQAVSSRSVPQRHRQSILCRAKYFPRAAAAIATGPGSSASPF